MDTQGLGRSCHTFPGRASSHGWGRCAGNLSGHQKLVKAEGELGRQNSISGWGLHGAAGSSDATQHVATFRAWLLKSHHQVGRQHEQQMEAKPKNAPTVAATSCGAIISTGSDKVPSDAICDKRSWGLRAGRTPNPSAFKRQGRNKQRASNRAARRDCRSHDATPGHARTVTWCVCAATAR